MTGVVSPSYAGGGAGSREVELRHDAEGRPYLATTLRGAALLRHPSTNKGAAFDRDERRALGLEGLLPPAVTTLELANGALAVIENSRPAVYGYDQRVEVFGSGGSAEGFNETPNRVTLSTDSGVRADNPLYFFLERYQASFRAEMEAFFACIREDREPPVGGRDGLMSVLVGLAAAKSMVENRPVKVESA